MLRPCINSENIIYRDLFCTAHRCHFMLNNIDGDWDVLHYSIPFSENKLPDFPQQDAKAFYEDFANELSDSIKKMDDLHTKNSLNLSGDALKQQNKIIKNSFLDYIYIEKEENPAEGKGDLYIVVKPFIPFFMGKNSITNKEYFFLASRLIQIFTTLHKEGLYFTYLDPLAIGKTENGRPFLSNLLYVKTEGEYDNLPAINRDHNANPASLKGSVLVLFTFLDNLAHGKGPYGDGKGKSLTLSEGAYSLLQKGLRMQTLDGIDIGKLLNNLSIEIKKLNSSEILEEASW